MTPTRRNPSRIVTKELGMPVGILNPHEHHSVTLKPLANVCKTNPPVTPYRQPIPADDDGQERRVFEAYNVGEE